MPEGSPAPLDLARQMLLRAAGDHPGPEALVEAAERLGGRLGGVIGPTGYRMLVARAVHLAGTEVPALVGVTVEADGDGTLRGIREYARANGEPSAAAAGLSAILGHVIGLLITFIGEDLAIRLVREAWPELASGHGAWEGPV